MPCRKKQKKRINTLWLLDDWAGLSGPKLKQKLLEKMVSSEEGQKRFWVKIDKKGPNECWPWIGSKNKRGYGIYGIQYARPGSFGFLSHRIAYTMANGQFPERLWVCHRCDNPPCCNPSHLFLGDHQANVDDMVMKNRQAKGVEKGTAKLNDKLVKELRQRYARGGISYSQIASELNMGTMTIWMAIVGQTWKHVKGDDPLDDF